MTEDVKISTFLARLSEGDARVEMLLEHCLGRVLRNAVRYGASWRKLICEDRARHIADWLKAAVLDDADWLSNVDPQGRPRKLMKFGRIESIIAEADKAALKAAEKHRNVKLVEGDETLFEELTDGWSVVRLLTPAALDRESALMQHCIGNGAYDFLLTEDNHYLSLRSPSGEPHATLEVRSGRLCQIQGKQNRPPIKRYVEMLIPVIRRNWCAMGVSPRTLRHVIDEEGTWHEIGNLPEGLRLAGDFSLFGLSIVLPRGLTIGGTLTMFGGHTPCLPEGLTVLGDLDLSDSYHRVLPDNLVVGGRLDLGMTEVDRLPKNLLVLDTLRLCGSRIKELPSCLVVGKMLDVRMTGIVEIPEDIPGDCRIATDRGMRSARSMRRRQRLSGGWQRLTGKQERKAA